MTRRNAVISALIAPMGQLKVGDNQPTRSVVSAEGNNADDVLLTVRALGREIKLTTNEVMDSLEDDGISGKLVNGQCPRCGTIALAFHYIEAGNVFGTQADFHGIGFVIASKDGKGSAKRITDCAHCHAAFWQEMEENRPGEECHKFQLIGDIGRSKPCPTSNHE